LVTPKLTGTLLPGITRDSIMLIARELGYAAEEGTVSVEQWARDLEQGSLSEVFACGTAAVITPVGTVKFEGGAFEIHGRECGPVAMRIREHLLAVQHGIAPDTHGWMHPVSLS
jgi:branched-chain amino acid aminotransferase